MVSGMIGSDALRGVLKLEAVPEDQVIPLRAVLPEFLLELSGGFRLDVADGGAETVADSQEALVGAAIPRLVADRPGVSRATRNGDAVVSPRCATVSSPVP